MEKGERSRSAAHEEGKERRRRTEARVVSGGAVGGLGEERRGDEAWRRLGEREERRGQRRSC